MKSYQYYLKRIGEYGNVSEVHFPIATVIGLPHVKPEELVIFEDGKLGEVFSLDKDESQVLLFSKDPVRTGIQVTRTDTAISIPVGKKLLGKIINPLGSSFFDGSQIDGLYESVQLDNPVKTIAERKRIKRSFLTGISIVDLLLPLGKGQRELVIGDRKIGKSAFLLTMIKNQIAQGSIIVYAAIGKKKSDIKKLQEFFTKEKLLTSTVFVASDPFDSPSLIFVTPYTAMSIAEYFRDLGTDVVVIFDDLSTHAKFYREVALLGGRFPGRDSYPGDIFYIHARLLERAGNFSHKSKGEVSITSIPVVETVEGDLTGFIATNIMGMTDGHIFFDSDVYYRGRRPAINVSLSVTRVGRQTQTPLKLEINHEITAFLTLYEKMQTFSHFGAELSDKVKTILNTGQKLQAFFNQHYTLIVPEEVQIILLALIWLHALNDLEDDMVALLRNKLADVYKDENKRKMFKEMTDSANFQDLLLKVSKSKEELLQLIQK
ncbi:hypothetical protein A2954_03455 [Candidatus Roizmanbacteria bacterium RIFCSPLOWO2_01_FULL_37_12]|uniref:ATPase F1/V1/A1 complex alpha/beta subunit nucleotide-binding domain-containing protein n=1 Tax=Candidatus Roizmanbacteria bacterium RIFCSPLOWO2_01_FULL_37_12 TaxID=1802056 RepID=A0A1F7IF72_9BACT|nr:MAG: hypothetical protein A3D76_01310 [Candidatus Roizmanbacteria bacterium RIFCSPHIGHO2_02_FULL_37_9b]OGK42023.1 MAG: hypothetical protein A2954_03455 [Candidatus Roizmanbacteria bacterium RIFCSPLOWO2_01_FULL_37_12]